MRLPCEQMERWILGLMMVLTSAWGKSRHPECEGDVQASKNRCVAGYNLMLEQMSEENFYTGVDVEEIRSVCQTLYQAAQCTHNLKMNCPDTEHTDIEMTLNDLMPAVKMCTYTRFYEVYARNQFCYGRNRVYSEHCFLQYRATTEDLMNDVAIGDPTAVTTLCSHIDDLVSCISTNIEVNCNSEAAALIPLLVHPSVWNSEHCHNDTTTTTSTAKPPSSTVEPMVIDASQPGKESSYKSTSSSIHRSWLAWTYGVLRLITSLLL